MTVMAIGAVLGGRKTLKGKLESEQDLRELTRAGIPAGTLSILAEELAIERKALARVVGISDRTLSRRLTASTTLSAEESDRVVRLARMVALATDTFEDKDKAVRWLKTPNRVLDGHPPLSLLDTDQGTRSVEAVLGRIEYGIYG